MHMGLGGNVDKKPLPLNSNKTLNINTLYIKINSSFIIHHLLRVSIFQKRITQNGDDDQRRTDIKST